MRKSKYNPNPKTLGEIICKERIDKGLALINISYPAGITESYLSRIECGKQIPSKDIVDRIEKILNCKRGFLLKHWVCSYCGCKLEEKK